MEQRGKTAGTRVKGKTAVAAAAVPRRLIPSNHNYANCVSIEETSESAGAACAAGTAGTAVTAACALVTAYISIKETSESAGAAGPAVAACISIVEAVSD